MHEKPSILAEFIARQLPDCRRRVRGSLEGGSKHLEIQGETASDRLKPGLHTLCPSFAREICGLRSPLADRG